MIVPNNNFLHAHRDVLLDGVNRHRLPTIYSGLLWAEDGGIVTYAIDIFEHFELAGQYAGRILDGVSPSRLPVLSPNYLLVVNLSTANAQGIDIPVDLLATADRVIE